MKSLAQQLAIAGGSIVLTVAASSSSVQAATIQSFFVDVAAGGLAGQTFNGYFRFDESLLSGSGLENLSAGDGLTLSFDFLGTTYTEADDFGFSTGLFPQVSFEDGLFSGLNYVVDTADLFFAIDDGAGLSGASFEYELGPFDMPTDTGSGALRAGESTQVPEPTAVLSLLVTGGLGLARQKQFA